MLRSLSCTDYSEFEESIVVDLANLLSLSSCWSTDGNRPTVAGTTRKNVTQELVRVFEVKRLATSKLHDVRRQQLRCDNSVSDQHRALTRRLVLWLDVLFTESTDSTSCAQRALTRRLVLWLDVLCTSSTVTATLGALVYELMNISWPTSITLRNISAVSPTLSRGTAGDAVFLFVLVDICYSSHNTNNRLMLITLPSYLL